ncbi:MAG: hypothetical protein AAGE86_06810, partial [Pseudomonadota bacterium]
MAMQVLLAIGSVGALLGVMGLVKRAAAQWEWEPEVQRKLVHIATGLYAITLPWLFPDRWPVYMLVGMSLFVLMILRTPRVARHGLGSTLHGVERQSYGDILLAIAVGVTFFLAGDEKVLFVLPMAVLTLADAAAALAGSAYGKRFFAVEEGQKSVEGTVIFLMTTLLVAMCCLLLISDVPRHNVVALSLAVALFGTLIEAESWRGLDNFFLPVGLILYLSSNLSAPLVGFVAELLFLATAIAASHVVGQRLGLRSHTIRVYVILGFLILSTSQIQNTVLPIAMLGAHALARRTAPCAAAYPHLDLATVLAFVSVGWFALGTSTGLNASLFYQSTMAGMIIIFIALVIADWALAKRVTLLLLCGAILITSVVLLTRFNEPPVFSTDEAWLVALVSLVCPGLSSLA